MCVCVANEQPPDVPEAPVSDGAKGQIWSHLETLRLRLLFASAFLCRVFNLEQVITGPSALAFA